MCMFKNSILASFVVLCLASCNPVGETIAEIPLSVGEISGSNVLDLKKGDVVTIWSKITQRSDNDEIPFNVKYNIESMGKSIAFDSLKATNGEHIINAEKSTESYTQSSSEGDSTKYYTLKKFEVENKKITIPEDGKYNFDFKVVDGDYGFANRDMLIILRKTR